MSGRSSRSSGSTSTAWGVTPLQSRISVVVAFIACTFGAGCDRVVDAPTYKSLPAIATSAVGLANEAVLQPNGRSATPAPRRVDFGKTHPSTEARNIAERVVASSDAGGLPFLIVDKTAARVLAFDSQGRFVGDSAALLGSARGDDSAPGIGDRPLAKILPEERTTPAGRFSAELGQNHHGEDILWVDYDNAISMHRVRSVKASEKRLQRLASPTAMDNRISYGCINVPAAFYDDVVKPLFAPRNGIVYVLPETRPVGTLFETPPVAFTR